MQAFHDERVLGGDHVAVAVRGEPRVEAVRRLRGAAVTDVVGDDDVVLCEVEQLPGEEELARELRAEKLATRAARRVKDEHGVGDVAAGVPLGLAEGEVVEAKLREALAGLEDAQSVSRDVSPLSVGTRAGSNGAAGDFPPGGRGVGDGAHGTRGGGERRAAMRARAS